MALKDWKKVKGSFWVFEYRKKSPSSYYGELRIVCEKNKNGEYLLTYGSMSYPERSLFEKRIEALAFAKKYMRSH